MRNLKIYMVGTACAALSFATLTFVQSAKSQTSIGKEQSQTAGYKETRTHFSLRDRAAVGFLYHSRARHAGSNKLATFLGPVEVCLDQETEGELVCCTPYAIPSQNTGCSCLGKTACQKLKANCADDGGKWEDDVPDLIGHCYDQ